MCEFPKVERWIIDGMVVKWGDSNDDGMLAGLHLTGTVWVSLFLFTNTPLIIMHGVKAGMSGGEQSLLRVLIGVVTRTAMGENPRTVPMWRTPDS